MKSLGEQPGVERRGDRYDCIPDPWGTWVAWDKWAGVPAEVSGNVLIGLTQMEASEACRQLNEKRAVLERPSRWRRRPFGKRGR